MLMLVLMFHPLHPVILPLRMATAPHLLFLVHLTRYLPYRGQALAIAMTVIVVHMTISKTSFRRRRR